MICGFDDHGQLCITVKDTGIGIKEEDLPLLFGEYGRLKDDRSLNKKGIGLGLSIC